MQEALLELLMVARRQVARVLDDADADAAAGAFRAVRVRGELGVEADAAALVELLGLLARPSQPLLVGGSATVLW